MSETRRICVSLPSELELALLKIRINTGKTYSCILAELAVQALGLDIAIPGPGPVPVQRDKRGNLPPLPPTGPIKPDKRLLKERRVKGRTLPDDNFAF